MKNKTQKIVVVHKYHTRWGLWGVIIGFVGIFALSSVLSPLAFILGFIGFFRGQIISGLFAIFFAILGLLTSPFFMGLIGMSVLLTNPTIGGAA